MNAALFPFNRLFRTCRIDRRFRKRLNGNAPLTAGGWLSFIQRVRADEFVNERSIRVQMYLDVGSLPRIVLSRARRNTAGETRQIYFSAKQSEFVSRNRLLSRTRPSVRSIIHIRSPDESLFNY